MAWDFDRGLVIYLDRAVLKQITNAHARGEMDLFISDALHAPELFGPKTFIIFREADYSGFEIRGENVTPEIDSAAWDKVVHYLKNAILISREDDR